MDNELDFNDILGGGNGSTKPEGTKQQSIAPKLTTTSTRARQQSCMVSEVDKDLLPSSSPSQQQNFRMSLSNMLCIDKNDESLQNYKKQLLGSFLNQTVGNIKEEELADDQAAEVEIVAVEIMAQDRPGKSIRLDFQKVSAKEMHKFTIKEGAVWRLRIHFKVRYDIVYGLRFVNNVYKLLAKVDKDEEKMGSFAPQEKQHVFDLPWQEAPSGFLARGDYKGKGLFLDNDGIVHCQFNYVMTIDKEW